MVLTSLNLLVLLVSDLGEARQDLDVFECE